MKNEPRALRAASTVLDKRVRVDGVTAEKRSRKADLQQSSAAELQAHRAVLPALPREQRRSRQHSQLTSSKPKFATVVPCVSSGTYHQR